MGAQSSSETRTPRGGVASKKECYYSLLAIERTATQDEIKKAYRRKALELHPDRNYNDVERTTALFAEVQTAYQILSDPQERAWYDSHRDAILSGADPTADNTAPDDITSAEEVLSWTGQFSVRISYDDAAPRGFFNLAREAFGTLAAEEARAAAYEGLEPPDLPAFGSANDTYEGGEVKRFYQAWGSFYTVKTFAWCDVYRLSDAPDRRVRRMMEKDNLKARDQSRAVFNDAVSAFVKFVRKRDPRYTPNSMSEAARQAELRKKSAEQAKRQRAENAEKRGEWQAPAWEKGLQEEDGRRKVVTAEEEFAEEGEEEEWYECVVCRKGFRSRGMMEAHEASKKHKKAVWELKKRMRKEDREFDLERDVWAGRRKPQEEEFTAVDSDGDIEAREDEDEDFEELMASKPPPDDDHIPIPPADQDEDEDDDEDDDESHTPLRPASPTDSLPDCIPIPQPPATTDTPRTSSPTPTDPDSDYVSTSTFHARTTDIPSLTTALESTTIDPPAKPGKTVGKAKEKRLKRAEKKAAAAGSNAGEEGAEFACSTCGHEFTSKTKLFSHLKAEPGHARLIDVDEGGGGGKKGKKGKR